jgi:glucose-6-phosphate isomerase
MSVLRPRPPVDPLHYEPPAGFAAGGPEADRLDRLGPRLDAARAGLLAEVERVRSAGAAAGAEAEAEAAGIGLPDQLLADYATRRGQSHLYAVLQAARRIRDEVDRVVVLGPGCCQLGARLLFETCCHPFHNELSRGDRGGRPRLSFAGVPFDNDHVQGLFDIVAPAGRPCLDDLLDRWALLVADGGDETAAATRIFLAALGAGIGGDPTRLAARVIPVAPRSARLAALGRAIGCRDAFEIPPGTPEACLVFTAAGLLPAAIAGIDVVRFLEGAAAASRRFREAPVGVDPALQAAGVAHLAADRGRHLRIVAPTDSRLDTVGRWHAACFAGADGPGGTLDTRLVVAEPRRDPLVLPPLGPFGHDEDGLDPQVGSRWPDFVPAAARADASATSPRGRPQAEIRLPRVDEHALGQLLQLLILAAAVGRRFTEADGTAGVRSTDPRP